MAYQVEMQNPVIKYLEKVPDIVFIKLEWAILNIGDNPRPHGCEQMSGIHAFRIRVGDYRIIYPIRHNILFMIIMDSDDRREVLEK